MPCCGLALRLARSPARRLLSPADVRALADIADDPREPGDTSAELRWQVARLASEIGNPALAMETWSTLLLHVNTSRDRGRAALEASKAALALGDRGQARAMADMARMEADAGPLLRIELDAHQSEVEATSGAESEIPVLRAVTGARAISAARGGPHALDAEERRALLTALQSEFFFALRGEAPQAMLRIAEESAGSLGHSRRPTALHAAVGARAPGARPVRGSRAPLRRTARLTAVRGPFPRRHSRQGTSSPEPCTTSVCSSRHGRWPSRSWPSLIARPSCSRAGSRSPGCGPSYRRSTCPCAGSRPRCRPSSRWPSRNLTRTSGSISASSPACGGPASEQRATGITLAP